MKLYSVTIRGIKYYFEAQISDEQYKLVNKMCETIQEESQKYCAEDIFSLFTNRILTETNLHKETGRIALIGSPPGFFITSLQLLL